MSRGQNTRHIDQRRVLPVIGVNRRLQRLHHLIRLILTLIEVAKIDVRIGRLAYRSRGLELRLRSREWHSSSFAISASITVRLGREARLHLCGQRLSLIHPAANNTGSGNIKLAKIVHRVNIARPQLHRPLKRGRTFFAYPNALNALACDAFSP